MMNVPINSGPGGANATEANPVRPAQRLLLPGVFFLAAAIAAGMGVPVLLQGPCPSCTGLLSLVLPWLGAVFYAILGVASLRAPASVQITNALTLSVFVHACLVTEMLLLGRLCLGCLSIAGLALLAANLQASRAPGSRLASFAGLLLGTGAGFLFPFDRVEDTLTRRFWPAHILSQAPSFVDQRELTSCAHPSMVRLFTFEDERTCQSCAGLGKRLFSQLSRDFPTEVCVHNHIIRKLSSGQILPVIVLLSRQNDLIVYEGVPNYKEFKQLLRSLINDGRSLPPGKGD